MMSLNAEVKKDPAEAIYASLLKRVALMGTFNPIEILPKDCEQETKLSVLSRLGSECEEVMSADAVLWRLTREARRRELASFKSAAEVKKMLKDLPTASNDIFGTALRAALLGSAYTPPPEADLDQVILAFRFANETPLGRSKSAAAPDPIIRLATQQQHEANQRALLPGKLFGRDKELSALTSFLRTKAIPTLGRLDTLGADHPNLALLVTGIGGVGKSALIASAIRLASNAVEFPPLVVLDIDRANLYSANHLEIVREICRQLERQVPAWEKKLRDVRQQLSRDRAFDESATYIGEEWALILLRDALRKPLKQDGRGLGSGSVGIIIDTFEEILIRGKPAVLDILEWFKKLRTEGGLQDMRLVVSARSEPLQDHELNEYFSAHIKLEGIDTDAGAALLMEHDGEDLFGGDRAVKAADALQGHPQALRLLKWFGRDNPDSIEEIVTTGLENSGFGAEFAQRFLFSRILDRIRDPEVRKLAHPGLALRRVTPLLIKDVMAGPCGLGQLTLEEAKSLFDKLAQTAWIVEKVTDGEVHHRRDLRRMMLPAMHNRSADTKEKQSLCRAVQKIHQRAAKWYGNFTDPKLDRESQSVEAFYHRANLGNGEQVKPQEVERYAGRLGEDLHELPIRVRALGKVILGRGQSLTPEEFKILPDSFRNKLRADRELRALAQGQTQEIKRSDFTSSDTETTKRSPARPPLARSFAEAEKMFGRQLSALWAEANFEGVVDLGNRIYTDLWLANSEVIESADGNVTSTGVWKYLLSQLIIEEWPAVLKASGTAKRPPQHLVARQLIETRGRTTSTTMLTAAFALQAKTAQRQAELDWFLNEPVTHITGEPITTTFDLRLLQLQRRTKSLRSCRIAGPLIRLLSPQAMNTYRNGLVHWDWKTRADKLKAEKEIKAFFKSRSSVRPSWLRLVKLFDYAMLMVESEAGILHALDTADTIESRVNELHVPVIHAMIKARLTAENIKRLVAFAENAGLQRADIEINNPRDVPASLTRRQLALLVDHADQSGVLEDLVTLASKHSPTRELDQVLRLLIQIEHTFHIKNRERPARRTK